MTHTLFRARGVARSKILLHELESLGLFITTHPLEAYQELVSRKRENENFISARELSFHRNKKISALGWLVTRKLVYTKKEEPMEFITFEDETGLFECTLFPALYKKLFPYLTEYRAFLLFGEVQEDFGAFTLNIEDLKPLESV